jgi:hypothetical protein
MRYFNILSIFVLLCALMTVSAFAQTPPRVLVQKLILEDGDIMDLVTNTGNTHCEDYVLTALHIESGAEISTESGETPVENLRINQVDAGFVAAIVNQSAFPFVWPAGDTIKLIVTYLPTNQTRSKDITIPDGTNAIILADEGQEMIVPPCDVTLPVELSSFTASVTVNSFVELQWTTETETNLLGYNVLRHTEEILNEAEAINPSIITAANTSSITEYSYLDESVSAGTTYYYWLQVSDLDLTNGFHGPIAVTIEDEPELPPIVFETKLNANYPNPFNPETNISYSLSEDVSMMELKIYNVKGQEVRTLHSGPHAKGEYNVVWSGKDNGGKSVTSGVYFFHMKTSTYNEINKMMMLK